MFIKARKTPVALAVASCLALLASSSQAQIADLGTLGGTYSSALDISADGSVVVGYASNASGARSFRWTYSSGMEDLGTLGGTNSNAAAISSDGAVVVGHADLNTGYHHAYRWTRADGMVDLGTLGGEYSSAFGVSNDGGIVVGNSKVRANEVVAGMTIYYLDFHAFRWTASGMVDLGTLGGRESGASDVSADGSVIVGSAQNALGESLAFRWVQGTSADGLTTFDTEGNSGGAMIGLGTLGGAGSSASGVSSNGSVVVGSSGTSGGYVHAFRWTNDGMVDLGTLGGGESWANGTSSDGSVVVGSAEASNNGPYRAFRWTQANGMQSVENWLRANGVTVASDITSEAKATNNDGSVVVGSLIGGHAFIARVSSVGSGLVTLADVQNSLSGTAAGGSMALTSAGLSINGAHSRPLMRRVAAGQKTFWVAGDWGRDDHGTRAGSLGLAEVGGGYNFGRIQFNASLGQTWASQKLVQNGLAEVDGTYLQAEAIMPVAGSIWATLGAYHHQGSTELKRGYLNAGTQDYSTGRPDVSTTGLRARLDWDNVLQVAGAQFSPYADLSYAESRLDGYTETSGGFPARFNTRKERSTEFRLGLSATKAVAENVSLVGQLEGVHRFERHGAGTSGQVVGLFGFNLPGSDVKQDWLRAGFGVQGKLAGGAAHVMLNATTQGAVPNVWLAAGWQKAF
ncbi:autotransporter domain-containing protein [Quatrionicoccus australiensis]|uniref:autotransporter domain-containing protein n=1 Tax=Quatrionicoccus australiensis TaxID=138118 RepID=UPI001CF85D2E|nr:autotransporter domain-containing protein [Quatrionicoccus australiensis]UCV13444.1 autotransporter domain-containing protein [Quatrionicoccus australiensis]